MMEDHHQRDIQIALDSYDTFEILFRRYFERLYSYALKIVNDDALAKDLVQEVYIKLWEKREELTGHRIESLLFTMLRNQCISHLRHVKVIENRNITFSEIRKIEELYRIDFVGDQPLLLIEEELKQEIFSVMNNLPPKCREVFRMSRINGLSNAEIALELGLHIKSVEKHISKAMKFFQSHFGASIPMALVVLVLKYTL